MLYSVVDNEIVPLGLGIMPCSKLPTIPEEAGIPDTAELDRLSIRELRLRLEAEVSASEANDGGHWSRHLSKTSAACLSLPVPVEEGAGSVAFFGSRVAQNWKQLGPAETGDREPVLVSLSAGESGDQLAEEARVPSFRDGNAHLRHNLALPDFGGKDGGAGSGWRDGEAWKRSGRGSQAGETDFSRNNYRLDTCRHRRVFLPNSSRISDGSGEYTVHHCAVFEESSGSRNNYTLRPAGQKLWLPKTFLGRRNFAWSGLEDGPPNVKGQGAACGALKMLSDDGLTGGVPRNDNETLKPVAQACHSGDEEVEQVWIRECVGNTGDNLEASAAKNMSRKGDKGQESGSVGIPGEGATDDSVYWDAEEEQGIISPGFGEMQAGVVKIAPITGGSLSCEAVSGISLQVKDFGNPWHSSDGRRWLEMVTGMNEPRPNGESLKVEELCAEQLEAGDAALPSQSMASALESANVLRPCAPQDTNSAVTLKPSRSGFSVRKDETGADVTDDSAPVTAPVLESFASSALHSSVPDVSSMDSTDNHPVHSVPGEYTTLLEKGRNEFRDSSKNGASSRRTKSFEAFCDPHGGPIMRDGEDSFAPSNRVVRPRSSLLDLQDRVSFGAIGNGASDLKSRELDEVADLVEDLLSDSLEIQCQAAERIRTLTKSDAQARTKLGHMIPLNRAGSPGLIPTLVAFLHAVIHHDHVRHSPQVLRKAREMAAYAVLNLGINNDRNKAAIVAAGAVPELVELLRGEAGFKTKEAAVAALLTLSCLQENHAHMGSTRGTISQLVNVLRRGSKQACKDALIALNNLSISLRNRQRVVRAGAIRVLTRLLATDDFGESPPWDEPQILDSSIREKCVTLLYSLSTCTEGREAILNTSGTLAALYEILDSEFSTEKEKEFALRMVGHESHYPYTERSDWAKPFYSSDEDTSLY